MVNKTAIARILRQLDSRYNKKSQNPRDPLYYSKLSLLELCGWIEVTMDGIVIDCAKKHLGNAGNLSYVQRRIIQTTHSFTYDRHFRTMLLRVVGMVKVEELEAIFDPKKFETMKSSLDTLHQERNRAAHTYIANVTPTVYAPSVINSHFQNVYDGLKDIERCVRSLKF